VASRASGYARSMDLTAILSAPVRIPLRVVQGIEELTAELRQVRAVAERIDATLPTVLQAITLLTRTADSVDVTGQQIVVGGADLTEATRSQERLTRELIDGGEELTETAKVLHLDTRELIDGGEELTATAKTLHVDTRELEEAVGTVADTVEPLQGAAERVGRVTQRFSRSSSG
jgi:methyl-accepting chemotaxis protein